MNSIPAKDVVYVDIDDEITAIIDKIRSSKSKIIALVLPKRATTLQSVVNMKLLKRSADAESKHLVLITSEAGLLPLAANVGMYVAKNLQSKPEIPEGVGSPADLPEDADESFSLDDAPGDVVAPALDKHMPVGDLASSSLAAGAIDDSIELDNLDDAADAAKGGVFAAGPGLTGKKSKKPKKDSKLKIPNFNRFRLWMILGGAGLVALIVLIYVCGTVLPKATILVKTNSTAVNSTVNVTLSSSATTVDPSTGAVPASSQQTQKTLTQQMPATGQQNNGQKATGTMTITNCSGSPATLPAGTGFSSGSNTYISIASVTIPQSDYKLSGGSFTCKNNGTATVNVSAQSAGASYNTSAASAYTIANSPTNITAQGSAMAGGTDDITKVVQQSDIDAAKQKLGSVDTTAAKQQLQTQLTNAGETPITATFSAGTPSYSNSANVNDAADNVTVTETVSYTMWGAKESDLQQLISSAVNSQIDTSKQGISDYGLGGANFSTTTAAASSPVVSMQVTSVVGPTLKVDQLKSQVAGKKSADAQSIIKNNPGVTDVTVSYSPFWVSSIPHNVSKITLTVDKPQTTVNAKS